MNILFSGGQYWAGVFGGRSVEDQLVGMLGSSLAQKPTRRFIEVTTLILIVVLFLCFPIIIICLQLTIE